MSSRLSLPAATLLATIVWAAPAGAETFKLTAPDGTVHFTNAPSDPQYQRMGVTSGTDAGWLRLPDGDTAPYLQEIRDAAERYGLPFKLVSAVIRSRLQRQQHMEEEKGRPRQGATLDTSNGGECSEVSTARTAFASLSASEAAPCSMA